MTHSLGSLFQQTHSLEWLIYSNDPFTWKPLSVDPFSGMIEWPIIQMTHSPFTQMTYSIEWPIHLEAPFSRPIQLNDQMTHSFEWPIHLNNPFTQMTHLLEWPICLKASFSIPIHLNDPFTWITHLLEWPIHLEGPFSRPIQLNDPLTHSVEWPIHLNDQFAWMTHSLEGPFQQNHLVEWSNDPFAWMTHLLGIPFQQTHSLEWPIYSNDPFAWITHLLGSPFQQTHSVEWLGDPFSWMTHSQMTHSPFTWMTHLFEWPIRVQRWNVCLPLLSNNTIWSYEASGVIIYTGIFWKFYISIKKSGQVYKWSSMTLLVRKYIIDTTLYDTFEYTLLNVVQFIFYRINYINTSTELNYNVLRGKLNEGLVTWGSGRLTYIHQNVTPKHRLNKPTNVCQVIPKVDLVSISYQHSNCDCIFHM